MPQQLGASSHGRLSWRAGRQEEEEVAWRPRQEEEREEEEQEEGEPCLWLTWASASDYDGDHRPVQLLLKDIYKTQIVASVDTRGGPRVALI